MFRSNPVCCRTSCSIWLTNREHQPCRTWSYALGCNLNRNCVFSCLKEDVQIFAYDFFFGNGLEKMRSATLSLAWLEGTAPWWTLHASLVSWMGTGSTILIQELTSLLKHAKGIMLTCEHPRLIIRPTEWRNDGTSCSTRPRKRSGGWADWDEDDNVRYFRMPYNVRFYLWLQVGRDNSDRSGVAIVSET